MYLFNSLFKFKSLIAFSSLLFIFTISPLNAATTTVNNGFESGNLNGLKCSGNCPVVTTSPTASGKYAGNFTLTQQMPTNFRTEATLADDGFFDFGKEYWLGLNYRYEDWEKDSNGEMAPFQIHTRSSDYSSECSLGAAYSTAPFFMVSQDDRVRFVTYGGKVLWVGSIQKKQWLHIKVHFRMSLGSDGFIEAWKDGVRLGRVDGANGPKVDGCGKSMRTPYFKMGVYKWDWKRMSTDSSRRQIFIDNVKIAEGSNGSSLVSSESTTSSTEEPVVSSPEPEPTAPSTEEPVVSSPEPEPTAPSTEEPVVSSPEPEPTAPSTEEPVVSSLEEPVAHWSMVDGIGTSIPDSSGNGYTGTLVNGAKLITGEGVKFDGVNDHLDVGNLDVAGDAISLSAWFLADDLANCTAQDCRIISKATGIGEQDHYFMVSTIKVGSETRLRFRLKTNGVTSTLIADSGNIYENEWIHVVAVYDGETMILYKDGVEVGNRAKQGSISVNSGVSVWIGDNPPNAGSRPRPWKGNIDDVRIYNFPLMDDEIALLTRTAELVAHWSMVDGIGTSIPDSSGNGYTGTLVNGAKLITGEGVKFDGVNDHLDVGNLDVAGDAISLSAWFLADDLANCTAQDCRIISKATGIGEQDHYFMVSTIKVGSETRLRFRLKTNGVTSTLIADSGNIYENEWIHVVAVYDGETMILYKDGVEVGNRAKQGSISVNSGVSVWIGDNPPNAGSRPRPWKGNIDDVRIYNFPLMDDEIRVLAQ